MQYMYMYVMFNLCGFDPFILLQAEKVSFVTFAADDGKMAVQLILDYYYY